MRHLFGRRLRRAAAFTACWILGATLLPAQENWPQFRGPGARGVSEEHNLPETWSKTQNVVWAAKVPGRGWSSPIVWGDRVFLTSAVKVKGEPEKVQPGLYFGGERPTPKDPYRWSVVCLDFKTGKILWEKSAFEGVPKQGIHLKNSLASETPVTDGKRVYVYFGNVGLFAYDMDGNLEWKTDFGSYPIANNWGSASSPALHGDRIYVVDDNEKHSFVASIDVNTGKEVWRKDRDERSNWATPYVWENDVRTELVTCGKKKVRSYGLDGTLLWELDGMSSIVIPTPFSAHGLLYVASGYVLSTKKPLFAIRPGASGDISLKGNETSNRSIAWTQLKAGPYNVSPLVYGDNVYILYDRGYMGCYDAKTGKQVYDQPLVRIPTGDQYTASPWAYDNKIFCLSEDGDTIVVPAGNKFEILRKNSLDELCMATPAIVRGSLLIRTETQLYRIASQGIAAR